MNWAQFIRAHMAVLAGLDFFTIEVLTWRGLATYYVLFFLHLETRRVTLAGITQHPTKEWMLQMARNAVDVIDGTLLPARYALHDRDTKFCDSFRTTLRSGGVQSVLLPPLSPNLMGRVRYTLPAFGAWGTALLGHQVNRPFNCSTRAPLVFVTRPKLAFR